MNYCLQKLYYTSIYIFYLLFISKHFQISKNDVNPTGTSGDDYLETNFPYDPGGTMIC